uniref:Uncharacterized protein n=1 Tax=Romanomermis culicivorax TaxID=13658 RepID=A0A915IUH0_ROMCU
MGSDPYLSNLTISDWSIISTHWRPEQTPTFFRPGGLQGVPSGTEVDFRVKGADCFITGGLVPHTTLTNPPNDVLLNIEKYKKERASQGLTTLKFVILVSAVTVVVETVVVVDVSNSTGMAISMGGKSVVVDAMDDIIMVLVLLVIFFSLVVAPNIQTTKAPTSMTNKTIRHMHGTMWLPLAPGRRVDVAYRVDLVPFGVKKSKVVCSPLASFLLLLGWLTTV